MRSGGAPHCRAPESASGERGDPAPGSSARKAPAPSRKRSSVSAVKDLPLGRGRGEASVFVHPAGIPPSATTLPELLDLC